MKVPSSELTSKVIGAAIEVHKELGAGFQEMVYEEALTVELGLRQIPFMRQHPIRIQYKGRYVGEGRLDLLIDNCLVVELKSVSEILPLHTAQVLSYLKATGISLGLLINFNVKVLTEGIRRIILN